MFSRVSVCYQRGGTHCGYPSQAHNQGDTPEQDRGGPPLGTWWGLPPGQDKEYLPPPRIPPPRQTGWAMGGTLLAVTQEDCLLQDMFLLISYWLNSFDVSWNEISQWLSWIQILNSNIRIKSSIKWFLIIHVPRLPAFNLQKNSSFFLVTFSSYKELKCMLKTIIILMLKVGASWYQSSFTPKY